MKIEKNTFHSIEVTNTLGEDSCSRCHDKLCVHTTCPHYRPKIHDQSEYQKYHVYQKEGRQLSHLSNNSNKFFLLHFLNVDCHIDQYDPDKSSLQAKKVYMTQKNFFPSQLLCQCEQVN